MAEFDCKKCLHEKVCALWASRESQDASCFCTDGCDYFTPTLTPPNEWVNRVRELDELYTKLQIITGFTVEQLLEMFAAGYTLEKPDYSKSFEEMASLAETTPPNEPLTLEELREMGGQPYWHVGLREESSPPHWNILDPFYAKHIEDYRYGENWLAYRRPKEEE